MSFYQSSDPDPARRTFPGSGVPYFTVPGLRVPDPFWGCLPNQGPGFFKIQYSNFCLSHAMVENKGELFYY